jgi:hypothetical protein
MFYVSDRQVLWFYVATAAAAAAVCFVSLAGQPGRAALAGTMVSWWSWCVSVLNKHYTCVCRHSARHESICRKLLAGPGCVNKVPHLQATDSVVALPPFCGLAWRSLGLLKYSGCNRVMNRAGVMCQ